MTSRRHGGIWAIENYLLFSRHTSESSVKVTVSPRPAVAGTAEAAPWALLIESPPAGVRPGWGFEWS